MYCKNCGKEIDDKAVVCPHCGVAQKTLGAVNTNPVVDDGGFAWGLLGCCIPIVGLILFLVWKDKKPKTSKVAGIGGLVAVGLYILFFALMFVIGMSSSEYEISSSSKQEIIDRSDSKTISDSKFKEMTCTGAVEGGEVESIIQAKGDEVQTEEIISTADLTSVGIDVSTLSEEDIETIVQTMKDSSGMEGINGITLDVSIDGNNVITKAKIDYTVTDMKDLQAADLVDAGFGTTISLKRTVENYEKEGMTCY